MTAPGRVCGGSSMAPALRPGDPVHVIAGASPRRGDAVVFASAAGDFDVVHRFVFKVPLLPFFVHRGDAPHARVALASCDRIVGVAVLAPRKPTLRDVRDGWVLVARRVASRLVGF
jgi:hypothetical protein